MKKHKLGKELEIVRDRGVKVTKTYMTVIFLILLRY